MTQNPIPKNQNNAIIFRNTYNNNFGTLGTLKDNYNLEILYVDAVGQEHPIEDLLSIARFLTWISGSPTDGRTLLYPSKSPSDLPHITGARDTDIINSAHNASTKAMYATLLRFTEEFARNPNRRLIDIARIVNDLWCMAEAIPTATLPNGYQGDWTEMMGGLCKTIFATVDRRHVMLTRLEYLKDDKK